MLWNVLAIYIQIYKFLNPTQLLIYKECSFERNCLSSFLFFPECISCGCNNPNCFKLQSMSVDVPWRNIPQNFISHNEMLPGKVKTLILVFIHHMMSVDVLWRNTPNTSTKACKTLVNLNLITMLRIEANRSKMLSRRNWSRRNRRDELGCYRQYHHDSFSCFSILVWLFCIENLVWVHFTIEPLVRLYHLRMNSCVIATPHHVHNTHLQTWLFKQARGVIFTVQCLLSFSLLPDWLDSSHGCIL